MPKNNRNMNDVFGRKAVTTSEPDAFWPLNNELVGIEIEVEDLEGDPTAVYPEWTTHRDDSLRNGTEFVTSGPLGGRRLTRALDKFFATNYRYNMSPRTSTHIHVNASDNMTVDQFRNMFAIMYLIEPAVFRWADENRKWCGYCCPLTDLDPYRIVAIMNENGNDRVFISAVKGANNADRYYGLNVSSYTRHGTLEFRYFPCTNDRAVLTSWIKFVMYVKKAAMTYTDPYALLDTLGTRADVEKFITANFGEVAGNIGGNLDFDDCVGRVRDLRGMLGVTPDQVKAGEGYKSQRSKGLTKFLARTFPQALPDDPAAELAAAQRRYDSASEEFNRLAAEYPMRRDATYAALNAKQEAYANLARLKGLGADLPAKPAAPAKKPAKRPAPQGINAPEGWGEYAAGNRAADDLFQRLANEPARPREQGQPIRWAIPPYNPPRNR